ncbi:MAG: hypothetical protein V1737_04420 [Chloroflexota bacterium]
MDEMKSAFQIAMEKTRKLTDASQEEKLEWRGRPEGERIAQRFLKGELDLRPELAKYDEALKVHVVRGVQDILLRNVDLPRNDLARGNSERALEALKELKTNKPRCAELIRQIRDVFDHYRGQGEQQRKQALESLKRDFVAQIRQAAQKRTGKPVEVRGNVETHPQFQEQWRLTAAQLDSQYYTVLNQHKQELQDIS